ncbi:hypothetical protein ACC691_26530, partial [Rhizobium johnstonii]|uniref:hypothetical protein n=1 Tax=Rhizobium johnstonii TaxID=3019933 RepID=UPI003F967B0B
IAGLLSIRMNQSHCADASYLMGPEPSYPSLEAQNNHIWPEPPRYRPNLMTLGIISPVVGEDYL